MNYQRGCGPVTGAAPGEPALIEEHLVACERCRAACSGPRPPPADALCLEGVRLMLHWSDWGPQRWRDDLARRDAERAVAA